MLLLLTMFIACGDKEDSQDTSAVESTEEVLEDTSVEQEQEQETEDTAEEQTETGR